jgi:hypothetical protein
VSGAQAGGGVEAVGTIVLKEGIPLTHHNASIQVFPDGDAKCRVVWIADLLPYEAAATVGGMMSQGLDAMKRTLEGVASRDGS